MRVRDRDVCAGACPRDENAAAGEGKIERARRKVEKCGTSRSAAATEGELGEGD